MMKKNDKQDNVFDKTLEATLIQAKPKNFLEMIKKNFKLDLYEIKIKNICNELMIKLEDIKDMMAKDIRYMMTNENADQEQKEFTECINHLNGTLLFPGTQNFIHSISSYYNSQRIFLDIKLNCYDDEFSSIKEIKKKLKTALNAYVHNFIEDYQNQILTMLNNEIKIYKNSPLVKKIVSKIKEQANTKLPFVENSTRIIFNQVVEFSVPSAKKAIILEYKKNLEKKFQIWKCDVLNSCFLFPIILGYERNLQFELKQKKLFVPNAIRNLIFIFTYSASEDTTLIQKNARQKHFLISCRRSFGDTNLQKDFDAVIKENKFKLDKKKDFKSLASCLFDKPTFKNKYENIASLEAFLQKFYFNNLLELLESLGENNVLHNKM